MFLNSDHICNTKVYFPNLSSSGSQPKTPINSNRTIYCPPKGIDKENRGERHLSPTANSTISTQSIKRFTNKWLVAFLPLVINLALLINKYINEFWRKTVNASARASICIHFVCGHIIVFPLVEWIYNAPDQQSAHYIVHNIRENIPKPSNKLYINTRGMTFAARTLSLSKLGPDVRVFRPDLLFDD